jgi:hypothetical protein
MMSCCRKSAFSATSSDLLLPRSARVSSGNEEDLLCQEGKAHQEKPSERSERAGSFNQAKASVPHRSLVSSHSVFLDTTSLVWSDKGMPDWKRKNARGFRSSKETLSHSVDERLLRQLDERGVPEPTRREPTGRAPISATWHRSPAPRH